MATKLTVADITKGGVVRMICMYCRRGRGRADMRGMKSTAAGHQETTATWQQWLCHECGKWNDWPGGSHNSERMKTIVSNLEGRWSARRKNPIDYDAARREHPKLKAMLTRAGKDPVKVKAACLKAMAAWDRWGAWPDDWARWERALGDSLPWGQQIGLRELELRGNPAGKPRRSTSLAGLKPSGGWGGSHRCRTCGAFKPSKGAACPARKSMGAVAHAAAHPSSSRWNNPGHGRPVSHSSPARVTLHYIGGMGDDEYSVYFNGRVIARAYMSPRGGGKMNWSVGPATGGGSWGSGIASDIRSAQIKVRAGALKHMKGRTARINPSIGMPGMPHTWITSGGTHVRGGDLIEFYITTPDGPRLRRARVNKMLVFEDHVMVNLTSMGTYVDEGNFVRVVRRAKK